MAKKTRTFSDHSVTFFLLLEQLGGGTLWGLLSLLTGAKTFDGMAFNSFIGNYSSNYTHMDTLLNHQANSFALEMLEASQEGDNRNVDMLVGDIYGSDYSKVGLK